MKLLFTTLLACISVVGYSQNSFGDPQITLSKILEIQDTTLIDAESIIYDLGYEFTPSDSKDGLENYSYIKKAPDNFSSNITKYIYQDVNIRTFFLSYDRNDYNRLLKELKDSTFIHQGSSKAGDNNNVLLHFYEKDGIEIKIGSNYIEEFNKNAYVVDCTNTINNMVYKSFEEEKRKKK